MEKRRSSNVRAAKKADAGTPAAHCVVWSTTVVQLRVDLTGRILEQCARTPGLLAQRDGLRLEMGRLVVSHGESERSLRNAITKACAGELTESQVVVLERPSGRLGLQVVVIPSFGAAELLVSDPAGPMPSYAGALCSAYGLTGAEAECASMVVGGYDVGQIACERGVSPYTVRTLIKRALAKMGLTRQLDLVRHVLGGTLAHASDEWTFSAAAEEYLS